MADFDPEAFVDENSANFGSNSDFDPVSFVGDERPAESPKMNPLLAAVEGVADAVPGTSQLGAAIGAMPAVGNALDDPLNPKKWQRILSEYQRVKAEQEARSAKAQNDSPWAYGLSNLAGSVGSALAGGLVGKAALAGAGANAAQLAVPGALIGNEAMNIAARANTGTEQIGGGVGGDQLTGLLISRVISGGAGAARTVAPMLMKLPKKAQEKFFEAVGDTRLAKMLAEADATPKDRDMAKLIRGLRQKIAAPGKLQEVAFAPLDETTVDAADAVGLKMAKAARAGLADIGEGANYTVKPESGLMDDLAALSRQSTDAAAEKQFPGSSADESPFISRASDANKDLKRARAAIDSSKTDISAVPIVGDPNIKHKGAFRGESYKFPQDKAGWENKPAWWKAGPDDSEPGSVMDLFMKETESPQTAAAIEALNRGERNAGRARNSTPMDRFAIDAGKTGLGSKDLYNPNGITNQPQKTAVSFEEALAAEGVATDTLRRVSEGSAEAMAGKRETTGRVLDSARHWQEKLADAEKRMAAANDNKFERERLKGIAAEAQRELTRIQRTQAGRSATEKVFGGIGGTAGLLSHGPVGVPAGYMAGVGAFKAATGAADIAADIGAKLDQWATRDDKLGRAAQWALSAQGESQMARIMALVNLPEAQEELGLER
jgi:hypothetical protein